MAPRPTADINHAYRNKTTPKTLGRASMNGLMFVTTRPFDSSQRSTAERRAGARHGDRMHGPNLATSDLT